MPYVSIKITSEPKATPEQRERLIGLVTDALVVTLDKDPETTFVVIEEIDTGSWGVGGETVATRRARTSRTPRDVHDARAITQVVESYFDGIYRGDVALLREVFHPSARLVGFAPADPSDPALPETPGIRGLDEYLQAVGSRVAPRDRGETMGSRILSVQRDGPLAFVRAFVPMLGYAYTDHLLLVREAGRWRIVQKHFAHGVAARS
jgi:4-oxalocrotonate tautomerase family enzyme